jgi:hypothetical protein
LIPEIKNDPLMLAERQNNRTFRARPLPVESMPSRDKVGELKSNTVSLSDVKTIGSELERRR